MIILHIVSNTNVHKNGLGYRNVRSEIMEFDFDLVWNDPAQSLSKQQSFSIDFIEPPTTLAQHVTAFFRFHSDDNIIRDAQPANTGHLMVFLSGNGEARFYDGRAERNQPVSLIGPTNAAMPYVVNGPFSCFGCGFTPIGWRALTGISAAESCDRFADSDAILGPQSKAYFQDLLEIQRNYQGTAQHQMMVDATERFFVPRLRPVNEKHRQIVLATTRWLDHSLTPDIDQLYEQLPVAKRQAQRVIGDYFGCAPKQLMRKYRAVRAAMLLNDPACSDEQIDTVQDLFYDQSHMIREIRHFAGRTPARLSGDAGSLLSMWLDKENVRELRN
jgi:AraC-like DNA-binding protein